MGGRWRAGRGHARAWLSAAAALACLTPAGCGHAAASDTANTAVCANAARVDRLTIDRINVLHQGRFSFPARITVTDARHARAVARTLCALPRYDVSGTTTCGPDRGISYRLRLAAGARRLRPVTVNPGGCVIATGAGPARSIVTTSGFWQVLGVAAGLGHTSNRTFAGAADTPPAASATPAR